MTNKLFNAVYGCLIGGAIGDALGAPVEGWYYQKIREKYGRVSEFLPFPHGYDSKEPGIITDDTTYRHYLCYAIVKKGGRINPDDAAKVWLEKINTRRLWDNERMIFEKLRMGMNPWDTGKAAPPCGCAAMAIAPIGIINAGNPEQAYQDGFNIGFLNQDDVNRDAAGTVAAAVAAAFLPGATVEKLIETMYTYADYQMKRALERTLDLAAECETVDAFAERFYATMLDWTWPHHYYKKDNHYSGNSLEFVPVVPALLLLTGGEPHQSIIEGASFGRDCDTIASIIGNIVGILHGAGAFRTDWVQRVETANAPFFEELEGDRNANFHHMAGRLVEALQKEQERTAQRTAYLQSLLA